MRLVDAVRRRYGTWRHDCYRWYVRQKAQWGSDEQLTPGHVYRDQLTGERLTIDSIGTRVSVTRHDADGNSEWSTPKETLQLALDLGIITHDRRHCRRCPASG